MHKSTLRKTTLLSLFSLSTSQSTWGEPFTVANSLTAASSEALLPTPTESQGSTLSLPSRLPPGLATRFTTTTTTTAVSSGGAGQSQSSFTVSLASTTTPPRTMSLSGSASGASGASGASSASGTSGVPVQSTAGAEARFRKMGVVGVLAGAAGVVFV